MLTRQQRVDLASRIAVAMKEKYDEEGVEGDFADGERYLRDDTTDQELLAEEARWCR